MCRRTRASVECRSHESQLLLQELVQFYRLSLRLPQPGKPQVILDDRLDTAHFLAHFTHQGAPLLRRVAAGVGQLLNLLGDQVEVELDRAQRVAHLMGHLRGNGADHRQTLRLDIRLLEALALGDFGGQGCRPLLNELLQALILVLKLSLRHQEAPVRLPKRGQRIDHRQKKEQQHQPIPIRKGRMPVVMVLHKIVD